MEPSDLMSWCQIPCLTFTTFVRRRERTQGQGAGTMCGLASFLTTLRLWSLAGDDRDRGGHRMGWCAKGTSVSLCLSACLCAPHDGICCGKSELYTCRSIRVSTLARSFQRQDRVGENLRGSRAQQIARAVSSRLSPTKRK